MLESSCCSPAGLPFTGSRSPAPASGARASLRQQRPRRRRPGPVVAQAVSAWTGNSLAFCSTGSSIQVIQIAGPASSGPPSAFPQAALSPSSHEERHLPVRVHGQQGHVHLEFAPAKASQLESAQHRGAPSPLGCLLGSPAPAAQPLPLHGPTRSTRRRVVREEDCDDDQQQAASRVRVGARAVGDLLEAPQPSLGSTGLGRLSNRQMPGQWAPVFSGQLEMQLL